jgi:hypothetical protein
MRSGILILLVAGGSTLLTASCVSAPAADGFRERRLATVPRDARLAGLAVFSEDGRRVAVVEREDGRNRAVCGDWKSPPFDLVC